MDDLSEKSSTKEKLCVAYSNNLEYLLDELKRLDLLLHIYVLQNLSTGPENPLDPFKGLVLSDEAILRLFEDPKTDREFPNVHNNQILILSKQLIEMEILINNRKNLSLKEGVYLALPFLSKVFQMTEYEERCLLICLAMEIDTKYEKIYAFLQDDVTRKKPSVELVLKLLFPIEKDPWSARFMFDPQAQLMRNKLLLITGDDPGTSLTQLTRLLYLDPHIVNFLLGYRLLDTRLNSVAQFSTGKVEQEKKELIDNGLLGRVQKIVYSQMAPSGLFKENILFCFYGSYGSGKQVLTEMACQNLGLPLLVGDIKKMIEHPLGFKEVLFLFCREAILHGAALCFKNFQALLTPNKENTNEISWLLEWSHYFSRFTFLLSTQKWKPLELQRNMDLFIEHEFCVPGPRSRREIWEMMTREYKLEDSVNLGLIADKFRFTPGRILDVLKTAKTLASWHSPGKGSISIEDLQKACYAHTNHQLHSLADKINPKCTWKDLILPQNQMNRLKEIINQVTYRQIVHEKWGFHRKLSRGKGLNILFYGPPGTGKTTGAEVMAKELKMDMYRIDLSQVVSKYIGETEKNLQRIFQEAQESSAILFFDEADALFGKRTEVKDAHDRHANTEIAYLLQKMEEYDGVTILATNLYNNLDEAFIRRMQFTLEFPLPDEELREQIWRSMFPEEAPKSNDIDFAFLARNFHLSGGNIKNIVLTAAFLAADDSQIINMEHLIKATKQEFEKIGKILRKEDFGVYYDYF